MCKGRRVGGHFTQYLHFLKSDLNEIESFRIMKEWSSGRILDAGCGIGYLSNFIGAETAIDENAEVIDKAREFFPGSNFRVADALDMPFPDRSYDCVICYNVIEHFSDEDIHRFFSEVKRILKKKLTRVLQTVTLQSY